jgi:hypothetical protein
MKPLFDAGKSCSPTTKRVIDRSLWIDNNDTRTQGAHLIMCFTSAAVANTLFRNVIS